MRLTPLGGDRTRVQLRVWGRMSPWWFAAFYLATIIPSDYIMSMGMLRGLKLRAEANRPPEVSGREPMSAGSTGSLLTAAVRSSARVRLAAVLLPWGSPVIAAFQLALIAGAPLGRAAWGGTATQLPQSLRLASAVTILIYVLGVLLVLRRAGFPIRWISAVFARWGTWALVIILTLSPLANFLSQSLWGTFSCWLPPPYFLGCCA